MRNFQILTTKLRLSETVRFVFLENCSYENIQKSFYSYAHVHSRDSHWSTRMRLFFLHPACKAQIHCTSWRALEQHMPHADVFLSTTRDYSKCSASFLFGFFEYNFCNLLLHVFFLPLLFLFDNFYQFIFWKVKEELHSLSLWREFPTWL